MSNADDIKTHIADQENLDMYLEHRLNWNAFLNVGRIHFHLFLSPKFVTPNLSHEIIPGNRVFHWNSHSVMSHVFHLRLAQSWVIYSISNSYSVMSHVFHLTPSLSHESCIPFETLSHESCIPFEIHSIMSHLFHLRFKHDSCILFETHSVLSHIFRLRLSHESCIPFEIHSHESFIPTEIHSDMSHVFHLKLTQSWVIYSMYSIWDSYPVMCCIFHLKLTQSWVIYSMWYSVMSHVFSLRFPPSHVSYIPFETHSVLSHVFHSKLSLSQGRGSWIQSRLPHYHQL